MWSCGWCAARSSSSWTAAVWPACAAWCRPRAERVARRHARADREQRRQRADDVGADCWYRPARRAMARARRRAPPGSPPFRSDPDPGAAPASSQLASGPERADRAAQLAGASRADERRRGDRDDRLQVAFVRERAGRGGGSPSPPAIVESGAAHDAIERHASAIRSRADRSRTSCVAELAAPRISEVGRRRTASQPPTTHARRSPAMWKQPSTVDDQLDQLADVGSAGPARCNFHIAPDARAGCGAARGRVPRPNARPEPTASPSRPPQHRPVLKKFRRRCRRAGRGRPLASRASRPWPRTATASTTARSRSRSRNQHTHSSRLNSSATSTRTTRARARDRARRRRDLLDDTRRLRAATSSRSHASDGSAREIEDYEGARAAADRPARNTRTATPTRRAE